MIPGRERGRGPAAQLGWVGLMTVLAALACATVTRVNPAGGGAQAGAATAAPADGQRAVLEAADQAVRAQYLDAQLGGVEWAGAVAAARAQVEAGLSAADFAAVMDQLAGRLPAGTAGYLTRAERLEQELQSTATFQGIGIYYGFREAPEARVIVLTVMPGSPAEAAGLRAHDAIYAIDGQAVRAEERDSVVDRIRGPAGSRVTLSVQSPGQPRRTVAVERGTITAGDSVRGGSDPATGLVYYRVPAAADASLAQVLAADLVRTHQTQPVKGILLDLRLAGSSGSWPLAEMLALFGDGTLGEFYTRTDSQAITVQGSDQGNSQHAPLVILVGPDTRGAAEVLAGGLQASGRARLFGLPTAGETGGFTPIDLPDGSRLTVLTSGFRLPDGTDPRGRGLQPDVRVDADWDTFVESSDDRALQAARRSLARP